MWRSGFVHAHNEKRIACLQDQKNAANGYIVAAWLDSSSAQKVAVGSCTASNGIPRISFAKVSSISESDHRSVPELKRKCALCIHTNAISLQVMSCCCVPLSIPYQQGCDVVFGVTQNRGDRHAISTVSLRNFVLNLWELSPLSEAQAWLVLALLGVNWSCLWIKPSTHHVTLLYLEC